MFSKTNKSSSRDRRQALSVIGNDCRITGNIFSQGEVHVDGRVDGDIRCDRLVIGETGSITGEISAESIRVLGTVTGQIRAGAVSLAKTARIVGDITHDSLAVEAGAFIEGRFDRLTAEPGALPKPSEDKTNAAGQHLLTSAQNENKNETSVATDGALNIAAS